MKKSQLLIAAGAAMGLSAAAMAQNTDRGIWGRGTPDVPGDLIPGSLTDMQGQTGSNGHLGIQYLNGIYFASARVIPVVGGRANQLFFFDSTGTLSGQVDQIAGAITDAWGYRDGASDGTSLYFGWGGGVARHNADGTLSGLQIGGAAPGGVGTWRALAHDPDLDGGAGGFWTQSFGSSLITTDLSGVLLTNHGNLSATSLYGLALANGRLYGHSTGGDIVEINRNDGTLIGTIFNVASSFTAFSSQGGLSEVPGGGFGSGNFWDLAAVAQGTPDEFAVFELLVPAPGALALLGIGGLLMMRRRR